MIIEEATMLKDKYGECAADSLSNTGIEATEEWSEQHRTDDILPL